MAAGHQDDGALPEDLGYADGIVPERVPGVIPEQAQTRDSGLQICDEFIEAGAAQREADGRVALFEGPDDDGQEGSGQGWERTHGQGTASEARNLAQVGPGCLHLPDDLAGVAGQNLAGLGGHHPAGATGEQRLPHLLLELAQLLGDGRGRVHHQLGRRGDRALLHHLQQKRQPPYIEQILAFVL